MGRNNSILFCCVLLSCIIGVTLGFTLGRRLPRDELLFVSYEESTGATLRQHMVSFAYPTLNATMVVFDSYPTRNVVARLHDFSNATLVVDFIHSSTYSLYGHLYVYGYPGY